MNAKDLTATPEVTLRLNALETNLIERHTSYTPPQGSWPVGLDLLVDLNSQIANAINPDTDIRFKFGDNREAMEELFSETETAIANLQKVEAIVDELEYDEGMEL